jgi:polyvinyl alcohol dehydrogenase (cytochrome)
VKQARALGALQRRALVVGLVLVLSALSAVNARADGGPCEQDMPGGEWSMYGQDYAGMQQQVAEKTIGVGNVAELKQDWFIGDVIDNDGYQSPPPIVYGGCVFINLRGTTPLGGATIGRIEAYRLTDRERVWKSDQSVDTSGTFAVTVIKGRVHVGLNSPEGPRAAAFDLRDPDGHVLWTSEPILPDEGPLTASQQSSAIVFRGIQVVFTTGPDFEPAARQGYALIDAASGEILVQRTTISEDDLEAGYSGGGVWGTPTIDPTTKYLYVGTSNPESKTKEHERDNAIIKIDLDRERATFGQVVGSYKGTPDSVTGYDNEVCQSVGGTAWVNGGIYGSSPTCGQLDVDFGVGPTLWRHTDGRLLGAATQKSGWIHVFDAETMAPVASRQLFTSMSFLGGNLARIATDGQTLYVAANPGVLYAFDANEFRADPLRPDAQDLTEKWRMPLSGLPMKGGNVALANGVVYYVDEPGLKAFNAENGLPLGVFDIMPGSSTGSGVAIAGHHVIANHYGVIAAYRL